jgi:hypothetical protein
MLLGGLFHPISSRARRRGVLPTAPQNRFQRLAHGARSALAMRDFSYFVGGMLRPGLLVLPFFLLFIAARGKMIDPSRLPASGWAGNVGVPGGIPSLAVSGRPSSSLYTQWCNVRISIPGTTLVAAGDGVADDSPALSYAIRNCPNYRYVYLPAGTYRLNSGIYREGVNNYDSVQRPYSIAIKGEGPRLTKIRFYGRGNAISLLSAISSSEFVGKMAIAGGDARGSTSLKLGSLNPYFAAGLWATLARPNSTATSGHDAHYMYNCASQLIKVSAINTGARTITFWPALNEAYAGDLLAICVSPPFRCGIQDLYVENMSDNGGNNILLDGAQECWVKDIESYNCSRWHIDFNDGAACEVRECVIHDGWSAGGNAAYGVGLFSFCCQCLVENNIFYHCRHAMEMEDGGQGNVFGYNYDFNPINSDLGPGLKNELNTDYLMGDLIFHGGDPRWNLWEGNVASDFKFDSVLGGSGYNTAFRNLVRRKGLPSTYVACFGSDIQRWNYNENLVGNVYEAPPARYSGPLRRWGTDQDDASVIDPQSQATVYIDGDCDLQSGATTWDPSDSDHALPQSYYLTAKPAWFGTSPWPAIDPNDPDRASPASIPAGYRWVHGTPPPAASP